MRTLTRKEDKKIYGGLGKATRTRMKNTCKKRKTNNREDFYGRKLSFVHLEGRERIRVEINREHNRETTHRKEVKGLVF